MKSSQKTEMLELLLKSRQTQLSPEEANRLQKALDEREDLRIAKENLEMLDQIKGEKDLAFRPFFSGRVMHRINQLNEQNPDFVSSLIFAFKRLALPAFAIMLALVVMTLVNEQSLSLESITGLSEISVDDLWTEYVLSL